jgi:hypothetical protein
MQQGRRDRRGIISDIIGDIGDIGDIGAPTWVVDAGEGFGSRTLSVTPKLPSLLKEDFAAQKMIWLKLKFIR